MVLVSGSAEREMEREREPERARESQRETKGEIRKRLSSLLIISKAVFRYKANIYFAS